MPVTTRKSTSHELTVPELPAPTPRHETFRVLNTVWDVDALNAELDKHPEQVFEVRTQNLTGGLYGFVSIDETLLDTLEHPDRPIIVLGIHTKGGEGKIVVDGNHRLERAIRTEQESIRVFFVSGDEERRYRLR